MKRRLWPAVGAGALAVALVGFASPAGAATVSADRDEHREQVAAFVECLRDNGVSVPEPGEPGSRAERRAAIRGAIDLAMGECADVRPDRPAVGEGRGAERRDAMQGYVECLTAEGLEIELPAAGERREARADAPRRGAGDRLDADQRLERVAERLGQDSTDPAWIAANEECELPEPPGPRGNGRAQQD